MNKTIGILGILMLVFAAGAMAADPTGFGFSKTAVVTGDWKWSSPGWIYGNYQTAQFTYSASSPLATSAVVTNYDDLGTPWKYEQSTHVSVNAPTQYSATLTAITLNDPATTPATGGYTKYVFSQNTQSVFSGVSVSVSGFGAVSFTSNTLTDAAGQQDTYGKIN